MKATNIDDDLELDKSSKSKEDIETEKELCKVIQTRLSLITVSITPSLFVTEC